MTNKEFAVKVVIISFQSINYGFEIEKHFQFKLNFHFKYILLTENLLENRHI